MNRICTKILWSSKILWARLSENFLFAFCTSNDDSNFWKNCSFGSKILPLSKNYQEAKLKVFKSQIFDLNQFCEIVLTQNHWIWTLTQLTCFVFLLKFIEMFWSYKKMSKNWSWKRNGWVKVKHLHAQTIPDKILVTKSSNPVKLGKKRKVLYLFLRIF